MRVLRFLERGACGCALVVILLALLIAGTIGFFLANHASAAEFPRQVTQPGPQPYDGYDIVLVVDQSPSMWECDGIGSDPEMLRVDAARLFVSYLGADRSSTVYRVGIVHFGGEAVEVAPLTSLADAEMRRQLTQAMEIPQPIAWTDPLAGLAKAREMLTTTGRSTSRQVIVLLTDGEPAWPDDSGIQSPRYREDLRQIADQIGQQDGALFIIHLTNPSTSCSQRVQANWLDLWKQMAAATTDGALFTATGSDDLLPTYHSILQRLTGVAESVVLAEATQVSTSKPLAIPVKVSTPLASMTLVIWKENPETTVELWDPAGSRVFANNPGVTMTGDPGRSREEVWRLAHPAQGDWLVLLAGQGKVTVWQDRAPLPTPTPTQTSTPTSTPSATPTPTLTPSPTSTATATSTATSTVTPTGTAVPSPLTTPAPAPTAGIDPPEDTHAAQSPALWPLVIGLLVLVTLGTGGGLMLKGKRGPKLTGQLTPLSGPSEHPLPVPWSLDARRRRRVTLGKRATWSAWRLPGWEGQALLEVQADGSVSFRLRRGTASVNDQPVQGDKTVRDGDIITCGAYRIRYENLLQ